LLRQGGCKHPVTHVSQANTACTTVRVGQTFIASDALLVTSKINQEVRNVAYATKASFKALWKGPAALNARPEDIHTRRAPSAQPTFIVLLDGTIYGGRAPANIARPGNTPVELGKPALAARVDSIR
jgi:hypothetical protein